MVEVLHLLGDELDALELGTGVAGILDHAAGLQILGLVAHEGATLAGLDVLELDDGVDLVLDLETHAVLEVGGGDGCHGTTSPLNCGKTTRMIHKPVNYTTRKGPRRGLP